jgi:peroxiredoxin
VCNDTFFVSRHRFVSSAHIGISHTALNVRVKKSHYEGTMSDHSIGTPDWSKIPVPEDDGAARHLLGMAMASIPLPATNQLMVDLASLKGQVVVYIYPRTGRPGEPNPDGWDAIAGARGCTPQSCSFRDHFAELQSLGVQHLFGLSTQDSAWQQEAAERLHLPFPLLSDQSLKLATAMHLPQFLVHDMILLKRLTLILRDGVIKRVFYPVFPPDQNASEVIAWLRTEKRAL